MSQLVRFALTLLFPFLTACGGTTSSGPSTSGTPSGPPASVTTSPQPATWRVTFCPCDGLAGQDETTGNVLLSESAGVGVTFTALDVSGLNASGATANVSQTRPANLRVAARSQATAEVGYHFPQVAQIVTVRIVYTGRDDNGNTVTTSVLIPLTR